MYKHLLTGCRSTPLAGYLKSVGVLRILAEQKDPRARAQWIGDTFCITTSLTQSDLASFFCEEYSPTPIVAPWNGGSGFYPGDNTDAVSTLASNVETRFQRYRETIEQVQTWFTMPKLESVGDIYEALDNLVLTSEQKGRRDAATELVKQLNERSPRIATGQKPQHQMLLKEVEGISKEDRPDREAWKLWVTTLKKARSACKEAVRAGSKERLLTYCRAALPDSALPWLDAVYALQFDGRAGYNPVLGTGGNDGRLELSNNFGQRLVELFESSTSERTRQLFASSLYDSMTSDLTIGKIGHFDPGRSGGFNQGTEVETKDFKINPWDFVLAIEGALMLAGASVRRSAADERSQFATPFTVRFSPVGFSSAAPDGGGRYETWLPLWHNPASFSEVRYLFGEGRATIGRRIARDGIEFARAIGTLGVDRGISSFERYAFLKRRGKSYVAVPVGHLKVTHKPQLELLTELDRVIGQLDAILRQHKNLPASLSTARHLIDENIFRTSERADPDSFSALIRSLGAMGRLLSIAARTKESSRNSLFGLSPRWVIACDDGSIEVRIAAALASIKATGEVGPIRTDITGADAINPYVLSTSSGSRSWYGNTLSERLGGVLTRRLMEADRSSAPRIPIESEVAVSPEDVMAFLMGLVDDVKIEELLWGFCTIDWRKAGVNELRDRWREPVSNYPLSRAWCLLKLLHSATGVNGVTFKREPRVTQLVSAGRIAEACELAGRRMRIAGLHPFEVAYEDGSDPYRLLASLLIPTTGKRKMESMVLRPQVT